jgi:hypothetical protein
MVLFHFFTCGLQISLQYVTMKKKTFNDEKYKIYIRTQNLWPLKTKICKCEFLKNILKIIITKTTSIDDEPWTNSTLHNSGTLIVAWYTYLNFKAYK